MKAIVYREYGPPDVLKLEEVPKPEPGEGEVRIKVHAASVNAADWRLMRAQPFLVRIMGFGLLRPKKNILGIDVAGRVEAIGPGVTRFQSGDEVFGDVFESGLGGFAEYVCAREADLVRKAPGVSFEEAAAVPLAAVTALQGLRDKGRIQAGQRVLIHGASGGVGTFAVQIAKSFGAEVTAVCSTRNVELARSLGADRVIDYTREDFARDGQRYDLILAVNGNRSILDYWRALRPNGIYVMVGGSVAQLFQGLLLGPWISALGKRKTTALSAKSTDEDLAAVKELVDGGKVRPVIDRTYPLSEVPQAIRYVEEEHARGKVVIRM